MGRVYAGWALSQAFYREHVYRTLGYESLEDFLVRDWEASFLRRDAGNLLSMIETWQRSDISDNDTYRGDLERALAAIRAETLIMPVQHRPVLHARGQPARSQRRSATAMFMPIPSIWGHRAGNPAKNPADEQFIAAAIEELLRIMKDHDRANSRSWPRSWASSTFWSRSPICSARCGPSSCRPRPSAR